MKQKQGRPQFTSVQSPPWVKATSKCWTNTNQWTTFFSVSSTCSFLARRLDSIESIKSEKRITEQWLSRVNKSVGIFSSFAAEISVIRLCLLSFLPKFEHFHGNKTHRKEMRIPLINVIKLISRLLLLGGFFYLDKEKEDWREGWWEWTVAFRHSTWKLIPEVFVTIAQGCERVKKTDKRGEKLENF